MIDFDECPASGQSCIYTSHGPNGESQCQYCGKPEGGDMEEFKRAAEKCTTGELLTPEHVTHLYDGAPIAVKRIAQLESALKDVQEMLEGGQWVTAALHRIKRCFGEPAPAMTRAEELEDLLKEARCALSYPHSIDVSVIATRIDEFFAKGES